MIPFLARRALSAVPTLLGISLVAFLMLNVLPTDPIQAWSGGAEYSAETAARLKVEMRLDRGPATRYLAWGLALLRGDLGRSLRDARPVGTVIAEALPFSLLLNGAAILLIYGIAVPFGLLGAFRPGCAADRLGHFLLVLLFAVPPFAAAVLLQQWLAVRLGWLPLQGIAAAGAAPAAGPLDLARHLVLPAVCLSLGGWASIARYSRAAFRSTIGREYLSVARAKGMSRPRACGHVLAVTAVPFVTLIAGIVPGLAGGSVLVEQIFSLPGVGRLYVASIEARDYPVVLGLTLLSAVLVLAGNLLVDLLYLVVDPRVRDNLLEAGNDAV